MIGLILTVILCIYIIEYRKRMRRLLKDADTVEIHYPDGSFTYLTEKDIL